MFIFIKEGVVLYRKLNPKRTIDRNRNSKNWPTGKHFCA